MLFPWAKYKWDSECVVKKEPLDELGLIQVLPAASYAPLGKASGSLQACLSCL